LAGGTAAVRRGEHEAVPRAPARGGRSPPRRSGKGLARPPGGLRKKV